MKLAEIRGRSARELENMLGEEERRLFKLRMDVATRQSTTHAQIRQSRRTIARIQTLLRDQELASEGQNTKMPEDQKARSSGALSSGNPEQEAQNA